LAVAAARSLLKESTHFFLRSGLNGLHFLLLLGGQVDGLCHFGILQRSGAALLQRDLLEAFLLVFFQNTGRRGFVVLGTLSQLGAALLRFEIAQFGE